MDFDITSYIMGNTKGKEEGVGEVVITGTLVASDPNSDGNIIISEVNNG